MFVCFGIYNRLFLSMHEEHITFHSLQCVDFRGIIRAYPEHRRYREQQKEKSPPFSIGNRSMPAIRTLFRT